MEKMLDRLEPHNAVRLQDRYTKRLAYFQKHFHELINKLEVIKEEDELRLDFYLNQFIAWLESNFQVTYNTFEYPEVAILSYGDFAINLNAEYYIVGIDLERFERIERVESEIREAVLVEFTKNKIEIPYPVREVILKK